MKSATLVSVAMYAGILAYYFRVRRKFGHA
jgi:hypothetical protein